jgi:hypothetical protein
MNKKEWLDYLYYMLGKQACNFRLCYTWQDNRGDAHFTKWIPYLDAQEDDNFIRKCNQREQLLNEVILDLDDGDFYALIERLKKDNVKFYAYQTKSGRARHIHTYWYELPSMSKYLREKVREKILTKYGCDLAFKIDSHMIPLENSPHWKTGEIKRLVYRWGDNFEELEKE